MIVARPELLSPLQMLELRLPGAKDCVEEHHLEDRFLHEVCKVTVRLASKLDPIVVWELNDFPTPERFFVLVNLLPKVAAPLEITLVDIEVVGVGKAAQQRECQR